MISKTDLREFVIKEGYNYEIILYQGEIRRLISILDSINSSCLADKFRLMILIRDMNLNEKTEFDLPLYKGNFSKHILSPIDFLQRECLKKELIGGINEHFKKNRKNTK